MPTRLSVRGPRGFSLIELLVVIAVIAVLLGLMLPALAASRDAGRASVCLSAERQINQAMHEYARDNKDVVPREGSAGTTPETLRTRIPWCVAYRPYLDSRVAPNEDLNDLFATASYYRCPSKAASRSPVHFVVNGFAFYENGDPDLRGEPQPDGIPMRRGPMPMDAMPLPAKMLYMSEFADDPGDKMFTAWLSWGTDDVRLGQGYDVWLPRHITPDLRPDDYRLNPTRHGRGSNAMYLDGHAAWRPGKDLTSLSAWQDDVYAR